MNKTIWVKFIGRVQGVGFRFMVLNKARKYSLTGWIRNLPKQDEVEAVFSGEEKKIHELISHFKSNPLWVRIDNITMIELTNSEEFKDFIIKY